jgi:hypothetical protein
VLAAAVVPHPPLLVPALAAGSAPVTAPLLAACDAAAADLVAHVPDTVVCVGTGERTTRHRTGAWGTFAGFGAAVDAPARHHDGLPHLPLSLTVARWLLDRVGWHGPVVCQEVAGTASPAACAALGEALARETDQEHGGRTVWLVAADGTTRRGEDSPGTPDGRAAGFDAGVAAALAAGDPAALAALDPGLAGELGASGRAAWQVLAAAVGTAGPVTRATLRYDAAPAGVGYLVAGWWLR